MGLQAVSIVWRCWKTRLMELSCFDFPRASCQATTSTPREVWWSWSKKMVSEISLPLPTPPFPSPTSPPICYDVEMRGRAVRILLNLLCLSVCVRVWIFFRWYLLNCLTFCNKTWYAGASLWARGSAEQWLAIFKVKVTVRVHVIKMWLLLLYISCISAELLILFVFKIGWQKCLVRLDCCVQGQGHSKDLNCGWMFAWTIASWLQNVLQLC